MDSPLVYFISSLLPDILPVVKTYLNAVDWLALEEACTGQVKPDTMLYCIPIAIASGSLDQVRWILCAHVVVDADAPLETRDPSENVVSAIERGDVAIIEAVLGHYRPLYQPRDVVSIGTFSILLTVAISTKSLPIVERVYEALAFTGFTTKELWADELWADQMMSILIPLIIMSHTPDMLNWALRLCRRGDMLLLFDDYMELIVEQNLRDMYDVLSTYWSGELSRRAVDVAIEKDHLDLLEYIADKGINEMPVGFYI